MRLRMVGETRIVGPEWRGLTSALRYAARSYGAELTVLFIKEDELSGNIGSSDAHVDAYNQTNPY